MIVQSDQSITLDNVEVLPIAMDNGIAVYRFEPDLVVPEGVQYLSLP